MRRRTDHTSKHVVVVIRRYMRYSLQHNTPAPAVPPFYILNAACQLSLNEVQYVVAHLIPQAV